MITLRAQFDGKVLVPVGPVVLQAGHLYEVDVREPSTEPPVRSPHELLQLLASLPKVSAEDIAEMERLIEEGVSKRS